MTVDLRPAEQRLVGLVGQPFELTITATLTDSDGNPIAWPELTDPVAAVYSSTGAEIEDAAPAVESPLDGVLTVTWTAEQTEALGPHGFLWQLSANLLDGGPYGLVAGNFRLHPPGHPGVNPQDDIELTVEVGAATVDLTISIGGTGGQAAAVVVALAAHVADTTGVHGIPDTSQLVTSAGMTAAISAAIDALIGGAPGALDTLAELAAALDDDAAFATTVLNLIASKVPLEGVEAISAAVDDDAVSFDSSDPGDTTDTALRIAADGSITARNFTSRLRKGHFYGSDANYPYEAGDVHFRISDYGNVFGGPNPWVGEDDDGRPRQIKRDRTGVTGLPPFQADLIMDLHVDTAYLGRRFVVGDTNDPVDAIIQLAYGPTSVVSGGSLGSPYVIGWDPIDIPAVSLGTSEALSAWGTRGHARVHRQRVFDAADAFEHPQGNNFYWSGISFGSPHKLTGCVGERYTVLNSVTLNAVTGQDVIIEYFAFQNESKGRLIKDGDSVTFTRKAIGDTIFGGQPAKKFTDCKAASGTITLNPGDHIYVYFKFGDGENLRPEINPHPRLALPGERPSWWTNAKVAAGLGRLCWRTLVIPPGGVSGVDAATAWSPYVAAISAEVGEDIYSNAAAGRIVFLTNPYGGTGNIKRVTIEPLGQLRAIGGFSLGPSRDLCTGLNLNSATPSLGLVGQYAYTNVAPLEYDVVIGAAMSIAVNTTTPGTSTANEVQTFVITGAVAGDEYAVRFNGETSAPIPYDADLTSGNNAAAAAVFRAALESLPSSQPGDFAVTRSVAAGVTTFTVTFGSLLTSSYSRYKVTNTAPTTITNLGVSGEAAIDGQIIVLRTTNTNTTIKHNNAGVGKIWLKGAADRAMGVNDTLTLMYDSAFQGFFEI